jgi:hypothetical protein
VARHAAAAVNSSVGAFTAQRPGWTVNTFLSFGPDTASMVALDSAAASVTVSPV